MNFPSTIFKRFRELIAPLSWNSFSILLSSVILSIGEPFAGDHVAPDKDEVYLQETGRKILTEEPVTSMAVYDKTVYVGSRRGFLR